MNVSCRFCSPPQSLFSRPSKNCVKIKDTILIFGINEVIPDQPYNAIVMNVSIITANIEENTIEIAWTANPPSLASPTSLFPGSYSTALVKNSIYIFGGPMLEVAFESLQYDSRFLNTNSLWALDLITMVWREINSEFSPRAVANHCGAAANDDSFVQYGGSSGTFIVDNPVSQSLLTLDHSQIAELEATVQDHLWSFNTTSKYWTRHDLSTVKPVKRFRCSMASMANGSVLLFGGLTVTSRLTIEALGDLWMLTLNSKQPWRQLSSTCPSKGCKGRPQPRFNNIFEVMNGNPIVYSGFNPNNKKSKCLDTYLWHFNINESTWRKKDVRSGTDHPFSSNRLETNCFTTGTFIGKKLVASFRYLKSANILKGMCIQTATVTYRTRKRKLL